MLKNIRNTSLILLCVFTFSLLQISCKKTTEDNMDAIIIPYALFFGTANGAVWNTNDGVHFRSYFPSDGSAVNSICTAKQNMLYGKENIYVNENDNPTNNISYSSNDSIDNFVGLTNNIVYNAYENKLYASIIGQNPLIFSKDLGLTWTSLKADTNYYINPTKHKDNSISVVEMGSIGNFYSDLNAKLYFAPAGGKWDTLLTNLPTAPPILWRLSRFGNRLVAFDPTGLNGIYLQSSGSNFNPILPQNIGQINCCVSYKDSIMYIGSSEGLYKYTPTSVTKLVGDLPVNAEVYDIAIKNNTYRSGYIKYFLFVGTSNGLFLSEDFGRTFTKINDGIITAVE